MSDTGPAKLPGIPVLQSGNPALDRWAQAVKEHLDVRSGATGNKLERAVTQRELDRLSAPTQQEIVMSAFVEKLLADAKFIEALNKLTTQPTTTATVQKPEVTKADLDAVLRKLAEVNSGVDSTLDGFEMVNGKIQLKSTVQMNSAVTVKDTLDILNQCFFETGNLGFGQKINNKLVVSGTPVSLYDLVENVLEFEQQIGDLYPRFDGQGKLRIANLPMVLGQFDMHDSIVGLINSLGAAWKNLGYLKAHTGYSGAWVSPP